MAIELHRPENVRVAFAAVRRGRRRRPTVVRAVVALVGRGLLVGFGLGLILVAGPHPSLATLAIAGLVALAVALFGWDR